MPTYNELKKHLITFFRPNGKSIFNIFDTTGTRYLFQLRLGLSPLRSHKKRHNFADTPNDKCLCKLGREDTFHFLFKCPFYATHIAALVSHVNDILQENDRTLNVNHLQVYLYGHPDINNSDNREILKYTIKYINSTNRFSET